MLGLAEAGQVGVNGRHDRALVAEVDLDLAEVLALFEQVRGIGMPQGMDVGLLGDAAGPERETERPLQRGAAHRLAGGGSALAAVALGREEQDRMAVRFPLLAQEPEGALGQGNVAVLIAFAGAEVQEHALGVDIADLQAQTLPQAQSARVNGAEADAMIQGRHRGQKAAHLGGGEHDGQFELGIGAGQFQFVRPGAVQGFFPEELDGADGLGAGLTRDLLVGLEMDAVLTDVLGAEPVGGFAVELAELAEAGVVGLLGAWADGQELQVIGE
jgi:hypothetical protein